MKRSTALMTMLLLAVAPSVATTQDKTGPMSRAKLEGIELEYEIRGAGEPVMLVHAGVLAHWFKPLMDAPELVGRYRLVRYHRIGYAGSSRLVGPVTIEQQADHLRALMRHLGIPRAHIVGHSSSANIALQLALDAPDMVGSLTLMEPALVNVAVGPQGTGSVLGSSLQLGPVFERYRAGDKAGAVDTFMRGVAGPGYRTAVDRVLPGAFDQAVADADTFFGQELPAVRQWPFTRERASRITHPALAVIGAKSPEVSPVWSERQELLLAWLPKAEPFVLPEANHLLHVQNPQGMAQALAAFFARHPVRAK